jgi:excisionase family DNA binding protein
LRRRKLLRVPQAVDYLDGMVCEKTVRTWIRNRKIEVVRVGGVVCIPTDSLDALIQRGTVPAVEQVARG